MKTFIKGTEVKIKAEYCDGNENDFTIVCTDDELFGRVTIEFLTGWRVNPTQVISTKMLEKI